VRRLNLVLFLFCAGFYIYLLWFMGKDEEQAAEHSREWVGKQVCGENAHVEWVNNTPQCYTKHGKKVKTSK